MNATTSSRSEYRAWLDAKGDKADDGDVAEYLRWMIDNPSPLGGLFGAPKPLADVVVAAVVSVATSFKGTAVEVFYSDMPEAGPRWVSVVTGKIVGLGFVCTGSRSEDAVMVENEHGRICAIPVRQVIDFENA